MIVCITFFTTHLPQQQQMMQQQAALMAATQGSYLSPMAIAAAQMQQMAAFNVNGLVATPMTPSSGVYRNTHTHSLSLCLPLSHTPTSTPTHILPLTLSIYLSLSLALLSLTYTLTLTCSCFPQRHSSSGVPCLFIFTPLPLLFGPLPAVASTWALHSLYYSPG